MNSKVLVFLFALILVNVCIGLPMDGLVNQMDKSEELTNLLDKLINEMNETKSLKTFNNKVSDGYYGWIKICFKVCLPTGCYEKCT